MNETTERVGGKRGRLCKSCGQPAPYLITLSDGCVPVCLRHYNHWQTTAEPETKENGMHNHDTAATTDVLAERAKQIAKGYTPEHDAHHTPIEILAFGGITWTQSPQGIPAPDPTREQLVRAAACAIAAIERMDRSQ